MGTPKMTEPELHYRHIERREQYEEFDAVIHSLIAKGLVRQVSLDEFELTEDGLRVFELMEKNDATHG
jgi:hypothetical protein